MCNRIIHYIKGENIHTGEVITQVFSSQISPVICCSPSDEIIKKEVSFKSLSDEGKKNWFDQYHGDMVRKYSPLINKFQNEPF